MPPQPVCPDVLENYEVIVIENNSEQPETFAYYKQAVRRYDGLRVVKYPGKGFNFSAINNFGRKYARAAIFCC